MARVYVFGDEAGNFDFARKQGASLYFMIGTITIGSTDAGDELLRLHRELAWQGVGLESAFHASTDKQVVRDQVFGVIQQMAFRFDATILEKPKAQPPLAADEDRFYKQAWYLHFKFVAPKVLDEHDELLVVAASMGTRKRKKAMRAALEDVVWQSAWQRTLDYQVAFWPAESDPCLQVADYCTWALQRKYESGDLRSYDLIKEKIKSEFLPFERGTKSYY